MSAEDPKYIFPIATSDDVDDCVQRAMNDLSWKFGFRRDNTTKLEYWENQLELNKKMANAISNRVRLLKDHAKKS